MKNVVVYTRVSTTEQATSGTSLDIQKRECLRVAEAHGARVVAICEDAGCSGAKYETRPGLQKALSDIESGEADTLIVWRLDRLGRTVKITLDIADRVDRAGAQIFCASDGQAIGKTAAGKLNLTVLAMVAELDRNQIRERTMGGRIENAGKGFMPSRACSPYGYHIVTKSDALRGMTDAAPGKYLIDDATSANVKFIFDRYAAGDSIREIARRLMAKGVLTPTGKIRWDAGTISKILRNPTYKGEALYGQSECHYDEKRITDQGRKTSVTRRQRPADQIVRLAVPPLVTPELWEDCQQQLRRNEDVRRGRNGRKFMLSGLMRCPSCGLRMTGATRGKKTGRCYLCQPHKRGYCRSQFGAVGVERAVTESLLWAAEHPRLIADGIRAYQSHREAFGQDAQEKRRAELEAQKASLLDRETKTARAQVAALIAGASEESFAPMFAEIAGERNRIQSELNAIPAVAKQDAEPETIAGQIAKITGAIRNVLTAPDEDYAPSEKQALLSRIVDSVRPSREQDGTAKIEIRFRGVNVETVVMVS